MEYIQVKPVEPEEDLEGVVADEEAAAAEVGEEELEVGGPRTQATTGGSRQLPRGYSRGPMVTASWVWPGSQRGDRQSVSLVCSFGRDCLECFRF